MLKQKMLAFICCFEQTFTVLLNQYKQFYLSIILTKKYITVKDKNLYITFKSITRILAFSKTISTSFLKIFLKLSEIR